VQGPPSSSISSLLAGDHPPPSPHSLWCAAEAVKVWRMDVDKELSSHPERSSSKAQGGGGLSLSPVPPPGLAVHDK
jgi:hypothetical protein